MSCYFQSFLFFLQNKLCLMSALKFTLSKVASFLLDILSRLKNIVLRSRQCKNLLLSILKCFAQLVEGGVTTHSPPPPPEWIIFCNSLKILFAMSSTHAQINHSQGRSHKMKWRQDFASQVVHAKLTWNFVRYVGMT